MVVFLISIFSFKACVSLRTFSSSVFTVLSMSDIQFAESTCVLLASFSNSVSDWSRYFRRSVSVCSTFFKLPFLTSSCSILTSISLNFVSFCSSSFLRASFFEFCISNCFSRWFDSFSASVMSLFCCYRMLTVSFYLASEILFESPPYLNKLSTWSLCN